MNMVLTHYLNVEDFDAKTVVVLVHNPDSLFLY
jgi:hypothetical protein